MLVIVRSTLDMTRAIRMAGRKIVADGVTIFLTTQYLEEADLEAVDWRTAATAMAIGLYAMLARHPWLAQAFGAHVFYGADTARHDEHSLAIYEMAGFAAAAADQAAAAVFMFVLGNALGVSATDALKPAQRVPARGHEAS